MTDEPIYLLSPTEAAERVGMTVEEVYQRGEFSYLMKGNRTKAKFKALWGRWERGKSNMPLSVDIAITEAALIEGYDKFVRLMGKS